jgi:hypothetical protein
MKEKTAVEWLFETDYVLSRELKLANKDTILLFEKAKEIEKKQIIKVFIDVIRTSQEVMGNKLTLKDIIDYKKIAETYYNEEFKN